jgi:hypothetical protein
MGGTVYYLLLMVALLSQVVLTYLCFILIETIHLFRIGVKLYGGVYYQRLTLIERLAVKYLAKQCEIRVEKISTGYNIRRYKL